MSTFTPFEEKMESAGISTAAIKAFPAVTKLSFPTIPA